MLTKRLGEQVSAMATAGVSQEARDAARLSVIDSVAVMLAGRLESPVGIVRQLGRTSGRAIEVGGFERCGPDSAALINGIAAHVLDYDDVALRGHPGAVMVPALIALAGHVGASGARLLDAYVAGYQVWSDLVFRDEDIHHLKGWHPTGVFGAVGAAAACSALLGLDARACSHALGLGASMSAGIMANFGSMAKSLHAGRAAQAGVVAATLAQLGYTSGEDALEHEQGFLKAVSPQGRVPVSVEPCGPQELAILQRGVSIKKYPTCYYTHRAIDAVLTVREALQQRLDEIDQIEVHMSREHATVLRNHAPQDGLAAKFSIEFAMACALAHGRVSLLELQDDIVRSDVVQRLMRKAKVVLSDRYSATWKGAAAADQVFVRLNDGSKVASDPQEHAVGDASLPLSRPRLEEKFIACIEAGRVPIPAERLLARLWKLEQENISDIWE